MAFTEAESAFIEASVPVHRAADGVRVAIEQHTKLTERAFKLGMETLGEESMQDAEYVHDLLVAAAYEAGFGDDSFIVKGLHNTLQEYRGFEAAQQAAASAIELPPGVDVSGPDDGLVL